MQSEGNTSAERQQRELTPLRVSTRSKRIFRAKKQKTKPKMLLGEVKIKGRLCDACCDAAANTALIQWLSPRNNVLATFLLKRQGNGTFMATKH